MSDQVFPVESHTEFHKINVVKDFLSDAAKASKAERIHETELNPAAETGG